MDGKMEGPRPSGHGHRYSSYEIMGHTCDGVVQCIPMETRLICPFLNAAGLKFFRAYLFIDSRVANLDGPRKHECGNSKWTHSGGRDLGWTNGPKSNGTGSDSWNPETGARQTP
jgi:hypothetical protein